MTWVVTGVLFGSPDSLPHEHLTGWPLISLLWTDTMAWVADSFVENLPERRTAWGQGNGAQTRAIATWNCRVTTSASSNVHHVLENLWQRQRQTALAIHSSNILQKLWNKFILPFFYLYKLFGKRKNFKTRLLITLPCIFHCLLPHFLPLLILHDFLWSSYLLYLTCFRFHLLQKNDHPSSSFIDFHKQSLCEAANYL